jgi:hypothetical protein
MSNLMEHTHHQHKHSEHCHHTGHQTQSSLHSHHGQSLSTAHHATVHCLTGCVIGEVAGLLTGVHFGMPVWATMALAVVLAYISGFSLSIFPLIRRTGLSFSAAFKAIWIGEAISIAVMELVMNAVDYHMGGMQAASVTSWQFWQALLFAIPAGYVAAFPVNAWLIGRQLKKCH